MFGRSPNKRRNRWPGVGIAAALVASSLAWGGPASAAEEESFDVAGYVAEYQAAPVAYVPADRAEEYQPVAAEIASADLEPVAPVEFVLTEVVEQGPIGSIEPTSSPLTGNAGPSDTETTPAAEENNDTDTIDADATSGHAAITPLVGDSATISLAFASNPIGPNESTTLTYTITRDGSGGPAITGVINDAGIESTAEFVVDSMFGGTCDWEWDPTSTVGPNRFQDLIVTLPQGLDSCTLTVTVNGGPDVGSFYTFVESSFGTPNDTLDVSDDHTHNVSVSAGPLGGGTATATPSQAAPGATVQLNATPSPGWHFVGWQVLSGAITDLDTSDPNATFTMPDGNVAVEALFAEDQPASEPVLSAKTFSPSQIEAGQTSTLTYTVTGTAQNQEFWFGDQFPAGLTPLDANGNPVSPDEPYLQWDTSCGEAAVVYDDALGWVLGVYGVVNTGQQCTISLPVTSDRTVTNGPGNIVWTDGITVDFPPAALTIIVPPQPPEGDLDVDKTGPEYALRGETVTWTITAKNTGPVRVNDAVVTDTLPAGVTLVSAPGCRTGADPSELFCAVNPFDPDGYQVFTITATINDDVPVGSYITNRAGIFAPSIDNGAEQGDDVHRIIVFDTPPPGPVELPELDIEKVATTSTAARGDEVTWLITASNTGTGAATNVVVTDHLPAGVTLVSATPNCTPATGGAGPQEITCHLAELAAGTSAEFTIVATVNDDVAAGDVITNRASVSADSFDDEEAPYDTWHITVSDTPPPPPPPRPTWPPRWPWRPAHPGPIKPCPSVTCPEPKPAHPAKPGAASAQHPVTGVGLALLPLAAALGAGGTLLARKRRS